MIALGIVTLVFSIVSLGVPLFLGALISALSGFIALWACKKSNYYALATMIINMVNLMLLTPQKVAPDNIDRWTLLGPLKYILLFALLVQIIAIVVYINNALKRKLIEA
tara:strand:+ start:1330 stop:1656 length:327 start_codon:yes stop_codon:yes gene_type:complete